MIDLDFRARTETRMPRRSLRTPESTLADVSRQVRRLIGGVSSVMPLILVSVGSVRSRKYACLVKILQRVPDCKRFVYRDIQESAARTNGGMNSAWAELTGYFSSMKVTMLITLVAILCNSQLCMEKVVTNSDQSGITMTACQVNAQIGIAEWLANGPYHEWRLKSYKCVMGKYIPKGEA
jgi:hypothetical protein